MLKEILKKIYIQKNISSIIKHITFPWKGKGVILMYHRVIPDDQIQSDQNLGMSVSCSNFEKQMIALKKNYKICSLDQFVDNLKNNSREFMVAITFDDGYKDNLVYALPILEKLKIPASIFITTRFLKEHVQMWWYELNDLIQKVSKLNFIYKNKNYNLNLTTNNNKLKAYNILKKIFINLKIEEQNQLAEIITNEKKRKNFSNICLTENEVKELDKNPLITIGSHGHNHLNLKILSEEEAKYEVVCSLKILENLLNHKINHFCYPFGNKDHASEREYKIIKNFNFKSALTGQIFPIKNNNLFALPRIYVGNKTCEKTLINNLSGFYNLIKKFF